MNIKNNRVVRNLIGLFVLFILILTTIIFVYKPWINSLRSPISYRGADDMSVMAELKSMGTEGTVVDNSKLGMPFGTQRKSVISYYLFNDMHIIGGLVYKIVGEVGLAANLTLFIFMMLNGLFAYIALRCMKIRLEFSVCAAWAFATLYYVFYRSTEHLMLSAYYCVPLAILICYWLVTDEKFFRYGKDFFKNKRNIATMLIALLIANNGVGYYPFFTCFFIAVSGLYVWLSKGRFKAFLASCAVILHIAGAIMLVLSPYILYIVKYGHEIENVGHLALEAELFALKISRLIFPIKSTGISRLDEIFDNYRANSILQTETSEYMGILAIIGLVVLIAVIMMSGRIKNDALNMMAVLVIAGICLSVVGGFGVVFNMFVSGMVRCYNRISIYLAFICLSGLGLFITYLTPKIKLLRAAYFVLILPITIISVYYQIPEEPIRVGENYNYEIDKAFVEKVESVAEEGAMIFQLPYHMYPEGAGQNLMEQDRPFVGYMFSKNLSWSYGAYKTGKSDTWNRIVSSLDVNDMVDTIVYMGFKGIFIQMDAYTDSELAELKSSLTALLNIEPMESDNSILMYYDLSDYYNNLKSTMTDEQWNDNVYRVTKIGE